MNKHTRNGSMAVAALAVAGLVAWQAPLAQAVGGGPGAPVSSVSQGQGVGDRDQVRDRLHDRACDGTRDRDHLRDRDHIREQVREHAGGHAWGGHHGRHGMHHR